MFLVKDGSRKTRRDQIRKFAAMDGCVGFLLAMIDFEWTFKRVVMVLGKSSLVDLRKRFERNMPFPSLPKRWDEEVVAAQGGRTPGLKEVIVRGKSSGKLELTWDNVIAAHRLRNEIVHGNKGAAGVNYISDRMELVLSASDALADFAAKSKRSVFKKLLPR